jgi:integrase
METTLRFVINPKKMHLKTERIPIYVRIIHRMSKAEGKLPLVPIEKDDLIYWNNDSQRFDFNQKKLESYNLMLNKIQNEFHHFVREQASELANTTSYEIRDQLLNRQKPDNDRTIYEAINFYYENDILQDIDKAKGTKTNYRKATKHFSNFLKHFKLDKLKIEDFKRQHASKFVDYLKKPNLEYNKKALNSQTVNSVVRNIKPFFNKMHFEEKIAVNPFLGINISFKRTEQPRLTNEDFKSIVKLDLENHKVLEPYRDLFLFLCYTGLSYCDAAALRKPDIVNGHFSVYRKKSNIQVKQFLIKQSMDIINKYVDELPQKRILPPRSLDKLNVNLKLIAVLAEIDYPLSTYTARRFFRQSIHEAGISEALVVKTLMGHTRSKDIDSHYFYVNDDILIKAKKKLQKHFKKITK